MKAIIYQRTGKIKEKKEEYTYGFKKCVTMLKDQLHIIDENQELNLNTINDLRDSAMHYVIYLSEETLYLYSQSGITLYDDLLNSQFEKTLRDYLPERVLPISTNPPTDIDILFDDEFSQIHDLIVPGKRKMTEAVARLRPMIILENNITGEKKSISDNEINRMIRELQKAKSWKDLFPGMANLRMDFMGTGLTFSVRLTKNGSIPVRPLREGEDSSKALIFREINLLDRYSLSVTRLAEILRIQMSRAIALVEYLDIKKNEKFFKEFTIGASKFNRYSPEVISYLKEKIPELDLNEVWRKYYLRHYSKKK
jgi:hypothetical protein